MTNPQDIATNIEAARYAARMPVTVLSERTGIADKTLRRRLTSPASFTLAELSAIARVLGVELEALFKKHMPVADAAEFDAEAA